MTVSNTGGGQSSGNGSYLVKPSNTVTLEVQLAKDLKNITSISNGTDNTSTTITLGNRIEVDGSTSKTVDVGGAKITNVAAGTEPNDAVNVSQLNDVKNEIANNINQSINKLGNEIKYGFANSVAMSTLKFMEIGINQVTVGAAIGTYKGTQAVAVGIQGAPSENTRVHAQISVSPNSNGTESMAGIGAAWRFNLK